MKTTWCYTITKVNYFSFRNLEDLDIGVLQKPNKKENSLDYSIQALLKVTVLLNPTVDSQAVVNNLLIIQQLKVIRYNAILPMISSMKLKFELALCFFENRASKMLDYTWKWFELRWLIWTMQYKKIVLPIGGHSPS